MEDSIYGAEHQARHASLRLPPANSPLRIDAQKDQSSGPHHRLTTAPASPDHHIPALPDESTIRAPPPLPSLKPFYPVVSDGTHSQSSPELYYPRVRYIFNDDDPDLLTDAFAGRQRQARAEASKVDSTRSVIGSGTEASKIHDCSLLVDLDMTPGGQEYTISSATSLTSDWAVTNAQVRRLQASPSSDSLDSDADHTMVLRVEGLGLVASHSHIAGQPTEATSALGGPHSFRGGTVPNDGRDYASLIHAFEERMAALHHMARNAVGA